MQVRCTLNLNPSAAGALFCFAMQLSAHLAGDAPVLRAMHRCSMASQWGWLYCLLQPSPVPACVSPSATLHAWLLSCLGLSGTGSHALP